MAQNPALKEIELRKQQLIVQSDLYRQLLTLEALDVEESSRWLFRAWDMAKKVIPVAMLALPILRLVRGKRPRGGKTSWLARALMVWQIFRQIRPQIESYRRHRAARSGSAPVKAASV